MLNQSLDREWNDFFKLWAWERDAQGHLLHCDDWPLYASVEHEESLKTKARTTFGMPAISAYINAFSLLKREGLQKLRNTSWQLEAPEPEFTLTKEQYWKLSAAEIVRRYRSGSDPEFRAAVDKLIANGEI